VLAEIEEEVPPMTPEAQESYFQEQVAIGEKLAVLGECHTIATCSATLPYRYQQLIYRS
jgi:hypothetical protein